MATVEGGPIGKSMNGDHVRKTRSPGWMHELCLENRYLRCAGASPF
ncbi:MAG: hypothetical protein WC375_08435 [Methanomassiliicoccales archaeon]